MSIKDLNITRKREYLLDILVQYSNKHMISSSMKRVCTTRTPVGGVMVNPVNPGELVSIRDNSCRKSFQVTFCGTWFLFESRLAMAYATTILTSRFLTFHSFNGCWSGARPVDSEP